MNTRRTLAVIACLTIAAALLGAIAVAGGNSPRIPYAPLLWCSDLSAALPSAQSTNTDVLLVLDGDPGETDTAAFERSILENEALLRSLAAKSQLVRIAYPVDTGLPSPHAAVSERLNVMRFPAMLLLDAQGRPVAQVELTTAPDILRSRVEVAQVKLAARDRLLKEAAMMTGVERARRLDEAMQMVAPFGGMYGEVAREIVELDHRNTAGLLVRYQAGLTEQQLDAAIQSTVFPLIDLRRFAEARGRLRDLLRDHPVTVEQRQMLLAFQAQLYCSEGDGAAAARVFAEAIELAPTTATAERVRQAMTRLSDQAG